MPPKYFQIYQAFEQEVVGLNRAIAKNISAASLKTDIAALQAFFQAHIWALDVDELDPAVAHQVQSFNVEIDKQLRLLSMDGMFLLAAKQSKTKEQRFNQMRDRLALLLRYCNGLLDHD
ncbi:heterocyst frequency control protein PatD [Leptolyngbyaceae cyanobacterium UHCC 1019]